jgi:hypothetical protein
VDAAGRDLVVVRLANRAVVDAEGRVDEDLPAATA